MTSLRDRIKYFDTLQPEGVNGTTNVLPDRKPEHTSKKPEHTSKKFSPRPSPNTSHRQPQTPTTPTVTSPTVKSCDKLTPPPTKSSSGPSPRRSLEPRQCPDTPPGLSPKLERGSASRVEEETVHGVNPDGGSSPSEVVFSEDKPSSGSVGRLVIGGSTDDGCTAEPPSRPDRGGPAAVSTSTTRSSTSSSTSSPSTCPSTPSAISTASASTSSTSSSESTLSPVPVPAAPPAPSHLVPTATVTSSQQSPQKTDLGYVNLPAGLPQAGSSAQRESSLSTSSSTAQNFQNGVCIVAAQFEPGAPKSPKLTTSHCYVNFPNGGVLVEPPSSSSPDGIATSTAVPTARRSEASPSPRSEKKSNDGAYVNLFNAVELEESDSGYINAPFLAGNSSTGSGLTCYTDAPVAKSSIVREMPEESNEDVRVELTEPSVDCLNPDETDNTTDASDNTSAPTTSDRPDSCRTMSPEAVSKRSSAISSASGGPASSPDVRSQCSSPLEDELIAGGRGHEGAWSVGQREGSLIGSERASSISSGGSNLSYRASPPPPPPASYENHSLPGEARPPSAQRSSAHSLSPQPAKEEWVIPGRRPHHLKNQAKSRSVDGGGVGASSSRKKQSRYSAEVESTNGELCRNSDILTSLPSSSSSSTVIAAASPLASRQQPQQQGEKVSNYENFQPLLPGEGGSSPSLVHRQRRSSRESRLPAATSPLVPSSSRPPSGGSGSTGPPPPTTAYENFTPEGVKPLPALPSATPRRSAGCQDTMVWMDYSSVGGSTGGARTTTGSRLSAPALSPALRSQSYENIADFEDSPSGRRRSNAMSEKQDPTLKQEWELKRRSRRSLNHSIQALAQPSELNYVQVSFSSNPSVDSQTHNRQRSSGSPAAFKIIGTEEKLQNRVEYVQIDPAATSAVTLTMKQRTLDLELRKLQRSQSSGSLL